MQTQQIVTNGTRIQSQRQSQRTSLSVYYQQSRGASTQPTDSVIQIKQHVGAGQKQGAGTTMSPQSRTDTYVQGHMRRMSPRHWA